MVLFQCCLTAGAQEFFDLTPQDVRLDSLLPVFTWQKPLGSHYADSVYTVRIEYPEFTDMSQADVRRYQEISGAPLSAWPEVTHYVGVSRKAGTLYVSLVPLVFREGRYQKLVSFKLNVQATARDSRAARTRAAGDTPAARYAPHSVLREGTWAKIRVPASGIYQLTDALLRKAGFSDPSKVKVYGYGGAMQPERLTGDYLAATDDLAEVPTTTVGGRRLFYAVGPVTWASPTATARTRNPYSSYGYYFLTESDEAPQTLSSEAFLAAHYPASDDYHLLYEEDDYAWFHGGRNLYGKTPYTVGTPQSYTFHSPANSGKLALTLTCDGSFEATVQVNDSVVGTLSTSVSFDQYTHAAERTWLFPLNGTLRSENTMTITQTAGATVRLDYFALTFTEPFPAADLETATFGVPELVGRVACQDHHADTATDMVIIIPTSRKWLDQAMRIKTLHEQRDGLSVRIVSADELYNEFASGTPDANAYRRYLKMFYDRAGTSDGAPRYLLLFGDGAWDNRMLSASWQGYDPDDFLLCYESDNSFSNINCYVSDDYFCLLDDEETIQEQDGSEWTYRGKPDVAVGRFAVRTADEARVMADKTVAYANNDHAGAWQNTICVMGDDGNNNSHMATANRVATLVADNYPSYNIQKIYWDAYTRTTSATGNSYPDVTRLIKERMQEGALIMNYSGHGAAYALSHELVVHTSDFAEATSTHLPLWLTASCDIMPFDGQEENIGETAMNNEHGGAVAFFGTTRTVYANYNEAMNLAFTRYVLGTDDDGTRLTIGEAARRAKCDLVSQGADTTPNKLQYTLLGDPALTLAAPTLDITIDSIGGQPVTAGSEPIRLSAGSVVQVSGHVADGQTVYSGFSGVVTATIRDAEETVTCRLNNTQDDGASTPFVFQDRTKIIYHGSDSVRNGRFTFTFAVPKDISYTEDTGLMTLYALSTDKTLEAHGHNDTFMLSSNSGTVNDSIGPGIYCYLNSPAFTYGGTVNTTPYFVAELYDDSGINASGSSIGHDLQLVIDGELSKTYNLNSYFTYDFGDYRSGTVKFSIPELAEGPHRLLFRAWDVMNNSSTTELTFNVEKGAAGTISVDCTRNPATSGTTFIITHDRAGTELDVTLDIYDTAGRQLWRHRETGMANDNTYTLDWDLSIGGGRPLMTGVYIYRITVGSNGGGEASQAKKLIVTGNK